jgi:phosphoribosylanthranilate isomerase
VKICGVRDLKSAEAAIAAGADFLGFNFVETSKRYIDPNDAKQIINELRIMNHESRTKFVGVFQNQSVERVNEIAEQLDLDFVQLHGDEDTEYLQKITRPIIKKMNQEKETMLHDSYFILLDRLVQGQGEMVSFERAKELAKQYQVFFSGGLTPENVLEVIEKVKPFAVDVAGGIETNGEQDVEKIKQFIANAKGVTV